MSKKILIVDDVGGWVRFHKSNLECLNKDLLIDTANCAKEALSKVECSIDKPYSTIFTDLQMESDFLPKTAGVWFIEQVKMFKEYSNTNIVIVSASENISIIAKQLDVNYVPKSVIRNSTSDEYLKYI